MFYIVCIFPLGRLSHQTINKRTRALNIRLRLYVSNHLNNWFAALRSQVHRWLAENNQDGDMGL